MGNACQPCVGPVQQCQKGILRSLSDDHESQFDSEDSAVYLNIYDLSEDWLRTNDIFQEALELGGAFHAGVQIYGREWSFSTTGVDYTCPRQNEVHVYRESILLGYTKYDPEEVAAILQLEMFPKWPGRSYDLLSRNCCSFSRSFCKRLTGEFIPDWVDRLPRLLSVVTKPVKGAANMAAGVGRSMNSAPRRDFSVESAESDFSVASFATTLTPTPLYDASTPSFGLRSSFESV
jgi:hypothetical protein